MLSYEVFLKAALKWIPAHQCSKKVPSGHLGEAYFLLASNFSFAIAQWERTWAVSLKTKLKKQTKLFF